MSDTLRTNDGQWQCPECTAIYPSPNAALRCCCEDERGYVKGYD